MASINIETVRKQYPGMTDAQAASHIAEEGDFVIVVRYKTESEGPYTNLGLCSTYAEADNYLFNEKLHDADVIYDRRNTSIPIPKILHNAQAIARNIIFDNNGRANEPCCWNCRHFNIPLSGNYICCMDQAGKGVVEIQRGDLCDYWVARDSSSLLNNDASIQKIKPAPEESSNVFLYGVIGTSIIALTIFVIVRYGEEWAKDLEGVFGIADGFWIGLFIFLGIIFVSVALLFIASIASKFEHDSRKHHQYSDVDSGTQNLENTLKSSKIKRMLELLQSADGNSSLAHDNRALFGECETWESLAMLSIVYEKVATLLHEAMEWDASTETAAHSLWRAANIVDGVPDHEETVLMWRKVPEKFDSVTVAKMIAKRWSEDAKEFMATAKNLQVTPNDTPTVGEVPKSRDFTGKIRKCISCGVEIPEGRLECPSCGSGYIIWE